MLDDVQRAIDDLADTLRRPITVADPDLRLISHTRSFGGQDAAHVESIVNRGIAEAEVRQLLATHHLRSLRAALRLPPDEDACRYGRVMIPLWYHDELCGFMTLIDRDGSLEGEDLKQAVIVSARIAEVLYRRQVSSEVEESDRENILRELLTGDVGAREQAANDIRDLGVLNDAANYWILAASYSSPRARIRPLKTLVSRRLDVRAHRAWLVATIGDSVVLLAAGGGGPDERNVRAMAERLATIEHAGERPNVAIGGSVESLADVVQAFERASVALEAQRALQRHGVIDWNDMQPDQMFAVLAPGRPAAHLIPPKLATMSAVLSDELLGTLRCFLENSGDVSTVAEQLYVHRSTVYYRLSRVEDLLGLDVNNGTVRLVLHWWLRLADLWDAC